MNFIVVQHIIVISGSRESNMNNQVLGFDETIKHINLKQIRPACKIFINTVIAMSMCMTQEDTALG
jgi:hypothetical protein